MFLKLAFERKHHKNHEDCANTLKQYVTFYPQRYFIIKTRK